MPRVGDLVRERLRVDATGWSSAVIVTDENVASVHLDAVRRAFTRAGCHTLDIVVPAGEKEKNLGRLEWLCERMVGAGIDRAGLVVALGGGVVGDLAGFAAATYMRGIEFVQIPTSLLAQVDSSVGGKVAVNLPSGKNLVGAFHQPRAVFIDPATLRTLPEREFVSGMAEVIKCGVIGDEMLFHFLQENVASIRAREMSALENVVGRCVRLKADIVEKDEREAGLRMVLNYGHTIGHALEAAARYEALRHGEAVALGMRCAAEMAKTLGLCSESFVEAQASVLDGYGLPRKVEGIRTSAVLEAMGADKKRKSGVRRFILPVGPGEVVVRDDVPQDMIGMALSGIGCS